MQSVKLPTISRSQTRPVWLPDAQQLPEHQPNSTFRRDYIRHSLPKMPDLRPKVSAYVSNMPFCATSEQRAVYQGDPLIRRRVRVRRGQLAVSSDPFLCATTYSQDFVQKPWEETENYKPKHTAQQSEEPFQAGSVYKCDFPRHEQNPSLQETAARLRQVPAQYTGTNPRLRTLDGSTEYGGNYLDPKSSGPRPLPPGYKRPTQPMASETSYSNEFVPFADARPAPMFRPDAVAFRSEAPFLGQSLYKDDFVPKTPRPSSAKVLTNLSGVMSVARREEPGMAGVPIETFPENLSGIMART